MLPNGKDMGWLPLKFSNNLIKRNNIMSKENDNKTEGNLPISDVIVRFLKDESKKLDIACDKIKIGIEYNYDLKTDELVITDKNNRIVKVIENNEL